MRRGIKSARVPVRDTCINCVAKHLGQAHALLAETCKGFPEHYWFAIGHFAEAEDECIMRFPALAAFIRDQRKQLEKDADYREKMPWPTIFRQVEEYLKRE